jgi:hypothetical protein
MFLADPYYILINNMFLFRLLFLLFFINEIYLFSTRFFRLILLNLCFSLFL